MGDHGFYYSYEKRSSKSSRDSSGVTLVVNTAAVLLDLCDFPRATLVRWHRRVGWVTENWGPRVLGEECVEFELGKYLKIFGAYI